MPERPASVLAEYAVSLKLTDAPTYVIDRLKWCQLDAIGAALFGAQTEWSKMVTDVLLESRSKPECAIWGRKQRAGLLDAVFANSMATHAFELDDRRVAGSLHPASATLPVALALAEARPKISGAKALAAILAGYEVAIRVGKCLAPSAFRRGFYPPGLVGSFGAATTAGRLLELGPPKMTNAYSITATQASGLYTPTHLKRFNIGKGTQAGVFAALLAERGFEGEADAFEAPLGSICSAYGDDCDLSQLTGGIGEVFETAEVELKPHVSSRPNHTVIDAVIELRRRHPDIQLAKLASIEIQVGTPNYRYGAGFEVSRVSEALMSIAYCAAVAFLDGDAFLEQFTERRIKDPALQMLLKKIHVTCNPSFDELGLEGRDMTIVQIRLNNGSVYEESLAHAKGHPTKPMSTNEITQKFLRLTHSSLTQEVQNALLERMLGFETLSDVRSITEFLS